MGVIDNECVVQTMFINRYFARTKLKSHLIAGKTYCAKMYVNASDKYYDSFTDGISMYFDNGQLDTIVAMDSSGIYPFVNPQVSNPQGHILSDTMNWEAVSGTFVANGTETFLTIGNFKTVANTTWVINPATYDTLVACHAASLLIDDVSVIEVNASNWLHDTTIVLGDSVAIGLPNYELPDGLWYNANMSYIGKGSSIKVKPIASMTQYIQGIDVCNSMRYDTMTVWAYPLGLAPSAQGERVFEVYPNPATNYLEVKIASQSLTNTKVEMYNSVGQIVYSSSLRGTKQTNSIDVSGFAKGMYYIRCANSVRKIIIE